MDDEAALPSEIIEISSDSDDHDMIEDEFSSPEHEQPFARESTSRGRQTVSEGMFVTPNPDERRGSTQSLPPSTVIDLTVDGGNGVAVARGVKRSRSVDDDSRNSKRQQTGMEFRGFFPPCPPNSH